MKKRIIMIVTLCLTIFSCSKINDVSTTNSNIVGKWILKETLNDPGDGSGVFISVNSAKVLIFNANGEITSNGSICSNTIESNLQTTGTYSANDKTIISSNCTNSRISYQLNGNILTISYFCDEGCSAKYFKIR